MISKTFVFYTAIFGGSAAAPAALDQTLRGSPAGSAPAVLDQLRPAGSAAVPERWIRCRWMLCCAAFVLMPFLSDFSRFTPWAMFYTFHPLSLNVRSRLPSVGFLACLHVCCCRFPYLQRLCICKPRAAYEIIILIIIITRPRPEDLPGICCRGALDQPLPGGSPAGFVQDDLQLHP